MAWVFGEFKNQELANTAWAFGRMVRRSSSAWHGHWDCALPKESASLGVAFFGFLPVGLLLFRFWWGFW